MATDAPSLQSPEGPSSALVAERAYVELRDRIVTLRLAPGTALPVRATIDYLACTDRICVPETARLALELRVGDGAGAAVLTAAPTPGRRRVEWKSAGTYIDVGDRDELRRRPSENAADDDSGNCSPALAIISLVPSSFVVCTLTVPSASVIVSRCRLSGNTSVTYLRTRPISLVRVASQLRPASGVRASTPG